MTKPSPHQLYMLRLFAAGWRFRLFNKKPGSWNTYWALRRKGLCRHAGAADVLTPKGRKALELYGHLIDATPNVAENKLKALDSEGISNESS